MYLYEFTTLEDATFLIKADCVADAICKALKIVNNFKDVRNLNLH